ncbi:nuclear transport factor 2 family protein [Streptomyces sp. LP05-1]|uniref:Nuclear transport factor 2 family protein n=1 Tax=Streptomyces pyxinae TaxID=2970734 RepID=A0ABT2CG87_9ACTN|nr:nuclear transport factor 2 family protein [Streptomyces sp. LP05-1]MCS0636432.1 nuclear transport factor 2 family protein [Streptomyces sp. LP05-1]
MTAPSIHELYERYRDAWAARDPDRIAGLHTADSVFHLHAGQPPARGREAVRKAVADIFALAPDLAFELVSLHFGEGFWTVQWKLSGTAPAGGTVDVDLMDLVEVEDGAVKAKHSYVDGVAMRAALTPAAAPPAAAATAAPPAAATPAAAPPAAAPPAGSRPGAVTESH